MRDTFAATLLKRARDDQRIMFLTGDLGFGVFEEFQRELPDQYLNVGVAEQNMIAVATGLALEGRITFAYSIGNFPVLRPLEQIRNDAAYHGANVKVVSIGGGFSYGSLGMSHHATEDIAVIRAMPEITAFTPGTCADVESSLDALLQTPGAGYLRLDKSEGIETPFADVFRPGSWRVMSDGDDVTMVACGGILGEVEAAAEGLAEQGISVRVVNAVQIAPLAGEAILQALGNSPLVLTVEEHVVRGGLGGTVAEAMAEAGTSARLVRKGISGGFMAEVGSQAYLRTRVGIDSASLKAAVVELVG